MSLLSVSVLQDYYHSRSAVGKFRAEPVYIEFMKQWNIGVYFSLRYPNAAIRSSLLFSIICEASPGLGR